MKPIQAMFGLALICFMLGGIFGALKNFRGTDFTEPHIIVTTSATQATVTLANEVMDDTTTNIHIVSNNALDAPVPFLYVSTNNQLTITGLNTNDTRTVTVAYKVLQLDGFVDLCVRYFPAFLVLGLLSIAVAAGVGAWENRRS